jgi:hypothetical protein
MPFEPIQSKIGFLERMRRLFLWLCAAVIMGLVLLTLTFLVTKPTPRQEKEYRKIAAQEDFLKENIQFSLIDAGYLRREGGVQALYVPALFVRIDNLSDRFVERLLLRATFRREKNDICWGLMYITHLEAGESRDIALKCLESVGFGTVFQGVSLIQTMQELEYQVWVTYKSVGFSPLQGTFKFKLIG